MANLFADAAFLETGWVRGVRIAAREGKIESLQTDAVPQAGDERHVILVPGTGNLHSHAFQRGMAGLAERRGPAHDNFWSWRHVMYDFALAFRPEQLEAVAAQLYMEMLEAGFTRVGEFHYLHHDRDGQPYANIAELAERIAAASGTAGIALTLLPVFYAHGNFGGLAPTDFSFRCVTFIAIFSFFAARPVASRHRKYRHLVSPAKWAFWGNPTHAEWAFDSLQRRTRETLATAAASFQTPPQINSSSASPSTLDPLADVPLPVFRCRAGTRH